MLPPPSGGIPSLEFHRQSETFRDAWRAAGHRAELFAVPERDHPTSVFMLGDTASPVCAAMAAFFESC